MSNEIEIEPIPGLPRDLPPGEHIVWQGRPRWRGLARGAFQVEWLALYFAVFIGARGVVALREGRGVGAALLSSAMVVPLALFCLGILTLLAWMNARATVYTLTTRRVVMRFGIAFPMSFNFPFRRLASADLKLGKGGEGDIALELSGPKTVAWFHLWPNARPWHLKRPQPMLRAIPEAAKVAALLGEAVQTWSSAAAAPVLTPARAPGAAAVEADTAPQVGLGAAFHVQTGQP